MTVDAIAHFFSDGLYAKQMLLPKDHFAVSHQHKYSHLSILAEGKAVVISGEDKVLYTAPACIEIKAGINHEIHALEDVVWYCIHATEEADVNKVDEVLIKECESCLG